MKKVFLAIITLIALTGCATTDSYDKYLAAHAARSQIEVERIKALATAASSGDQGAIMALALSNSNSSQQSQIALPKSNSEIFMQWAGILVPSLIQGYGIHANQQIAVTQSNNSAAMSIATTKGFVDIAGQIPATITTTTTNTIGGNGLIGDGSTYSQDDHTANTVGASGVVGAGGVYTTNDNHTVNPVLPVTIPAGKVCTIDPVTNAVNCI